MKYINGDAYKNARAEFEEAIYDTIIRPIKTVSNVWRIK